MNTVLVLSVEVQEDEEVGAWLGSEACRFNLVRNLRAELFGHSTAITRLANAKSFCMETDAQSAPTLSFKTAAPPSPTTSYMIVGMDIDAPFPSLGVLGPILHWIQPDVKPSSSGVLEFGDAPFVANYIGPAPPPGSAPHRYCFFVYEQPEGFEGKKHAPAGGKNLGNMSRMRWSLDDWERKAGLKELVAGNFFKSN